MSAAQCGADDGERLARAALCRVTEPGDPGVGALVLERGAAWVWRQALAGQLPLPAEARGGIQARLAASRPDADLAALARVGGRLVCPGEPEWPSGLDDLGPQRPIALWVRGPLHLRETCERAVAVVGARAATAYGEHVAGELAAGLADRGRAVISGGAYGIDAAAHRGALAAGGRTVAVLACGVDVPYPRGHDLLFDRLTRDGLLVSEWPPGSAPMRHRFLVRNRVIAAATLGTVVVEAAARSGALSTARRALGLIRPVMAVPGPVTSPMSAGCHALLREPDVRCVTSAAEVVEEVGRLGDDLAPVAQGGLTVRDSLPATARRVLDAVPVFRGVGPARIAAAAGVDTAAVLRCLGPLELEGLVEQVGSGYRLAPAARPPRSMGTSEEAD